MTKKIVTPGELVTAERKRLGNNTYMHEGKIYATCVGLVEESDDFVNVIPLEGKYKPAEEDLVVGIVVSEKFAGYNVDINSFYPAFLSKKELREELKPGSIISAKIARVNEINEVDLANVRVFYGGEIISVSPVKVPRIIGKNASMLDVLKQGTNANVLVGRNGRIWAKGGNMKLLEQAIDKIEREAHLENLTNRISEFLKQANSPNKQNVHAESNKRIIELSEGKDI